MSEYRDALAWAEAQVEATRDDPAARPCAAGPHLPVAGGPRAPTPAVPRSALSFMTWQRERGLLNPLDASPSGTVRWRAVNERLLRDGCEAIALVGALPGEPSSQAERLWLEFIATPTPSDWYRAHNASIVAGLWGAQSRFMLRRGTRE